MTITEMVDTQSQLAAELCRADDVIRVMYAHFSSLPSGHIRDQAVKRLADDLKARVLADHDDTRGELLRRVYG